MASLKTRPGVFVMSLEDFCQSMYHGALEMEKIAILLSDVEDNLSIATATLSEFHRPQSEPPKFLSFPFSYRQSPRTVKFKYLTMDEKTVAFPSTNLMELVQSYHRVGTGSKNWAPDLLLLISEEIRSLGLRGYSGWASLSDTDTSDVRLNEGLIRRFASALEEISTIGSPFQGKLHALIGIISKFDLKNPSRGLILARCSQSAVSLHRILTTLLNQFGVRIGIAVNPHQQCSSTSTLPIVQNALDSYAKGHFHYLVSCYENVSELSGQAFPRLICVDSFRSTFLYPDVKKKVASTQQIYLLTHSLDGIGQAISRLEQSELGLLTSMVLHKFAFPEVSPLKSVLTNTGAGLSYTSACSILQRFSPAPSGCAIPVFKFEHGKNGIRCIANISHLSSPVGTFSRWRSTQLEAKTEAAFTLCEKLLELDLLDDHLFSKKACLPLQDYSSLPGPSEESECQVKIPKPFIPCASNRLYLNPIKLGTEGLQKFAIATWSPIPPVLASISLRLEARPTEASIVPSLEPESMSHSQIKALAAYTHHVLLCLPKRDVPPSSMSYFIVPLLSFALPLKLGSIDWSAAHFFIRAQNYNVQKNVLLHNTRSLESVWVLSNRNTAS